MGDFDVLKVLVFYKNPRTSSLVMRNNLSANYGNLSKTNVVYEYRCHSGGCAPRKCTYIGFTTCNLSRRLTLHLQNGAIRQHHQRFHDGDLDRETIVKNTKVVTHCHNIKELKMLEAVYIREWSPTINIQSNMTTAIPLFNNTTRHRGLRSVTSNS